MQTFLPYADFAQSAQVLDNKRLGKQRVETMQIVLALLRRNLDYTPKLGRTWADHPIGRMWKGHLGVLRNYQFAVCHEWKDRGYRDTCLDKTEDMIMRFATADDWGHAPGVRHVQGELHGPVISPSWLGDEDFHIAHQSNLLRKANEYHVKHSPPHDPRRCREPGGCDPMRMIDWYVPQFPGVPHNLPYVWPAAGVHKSIPTILLAEDVSPATVASGRRRP